MWGSGLETASPRDVEKVSSALVGSGLFADERELAAFVGEGAWRIQMGERGSLVVLERWRAHLDVLSIRAIWCSTSRVPRVIEHLRELARSRGFGTLLSPVVAASEKGPYEAAGMRVTQELVAYRTMSPPAAPVGALPVRAYRPEDFERVCEIDETCFDDFWRYDTELLERYVEDDRSTVVECEGTVAGFAFCSVRGGEGVLGRIAVAPDARGRGIGGALTHEAASHMLDAGARGVGLCTQADNERSKRLYARLGFAEDPERLLMLVSSSL